LACVQRRGKKHRLGLVVEVEYTLRRRRKNIKKVDERLIKVLAIYLQQ